MKIFIPPTNKVEDCRCHGMKNAEAAATGKPYLRNDIVCPACDGITRFYDNGIDRNFVRLKGGDVEIPR